MQVTIREAWTDRHDETWTERDRLHIQVETEAERSKRSLSSLLRASVIDQHLTEISYKQEGDVIFANELSNEQAGDFVYLLSGRKGRTFCLVVEVGEKI